MSTAAKSGKSSTVNPLIWDVDQADNVRLVQNVFQQPLRSGQNQCQFFFSQ